MINDSLSTDVFINAASTHAYPSNRLELCASTAKDTRDQQWEVNSGTMSPLVNEVHVLVPDGRRSPTHLLAPDVTALSVKLPGNMLGVRDPARFLFHETFPVLIDRCHAPGTHRTFHQINPWCPQQCFEARLVNGGRSIRELVEKIQPVLHLAPVQIA